MKKTILAIIIFAFTARVAYAETQIKDKQNISSSKGSTKDIPIAYLQFQTGVSVQTYNGLSSTSKNMGISGYPIEPNKELISEAFYFIYGWDLYKRPSKIPIRIDLQAALRSSDTQHFKSLPLNNGNTRKSDMTVIFHTYTTNVYFDFHNSSVFTPYVSGGFGLMTPLAINDYDTVSIYGVKVSPTWSIGAGVGMNITSDFSADLSFKYSQTDKLNYIYESDKIESNQIYSMKSMNSIDLMIGLRYRF